MDNAYILLAQWRKKAKKMPAVYSKEKIEEVLKEAMSGDYKHLVETLKKN
jgi:hypothetical protein